MKVRITDLLDQLEDNYGTLSGEYADDALPVGKETMTVKQSKHRFSWKQGLSLAAALGVVVLGGFGAAKLWKAHRQQPVAPAESISASEDNDPTTPTGEDPVEIVPDDETQTGLNRFLTCLAQQGITDFDPQEAGEYELVSFAHLYLKLNERDKIVYRTEDDESYETFTLEQANEVLTRFFGVTVSPAEGTDYTEQNGSNYAVHEQFRGGLFLFPAADGDPHTEFSVCDKVLQYEGGVYEVTFTTYDVNNYDDYYDKFDTVYTGLRIPESEALVGEGELFKTVHGTALLVAEDGGWTLLRCEGSRIEVGPGHREDDEEWPEEYPVENYRLEPANGESVFAQSGELKAYRYTQLPAAEDYISILEGFLLHTLVPDTETMHDGYANHFAQWEDCNAAVSGSSVTGRFSFTFQPPTAYIEGMVGRTVDNRSEMEAQARAFVDRFVGITGELELAEVRPVTCSYNLYPSEDSTDVDIEALCFRFVSKDPTVRLEIQDGLLAPVNCGDSTLEDLSEHSFTVTVLPDSTIISADNYITTADIAEDGTVRMIDESDMQTLLKFMTSFAENDTLVITSIRADGFSVYFGRPEIEPLITVEYYFESDPETKLSTEMVLPGLFD